jgi:hypothetical protein
MDIRPSHGGGISVEKRNCNMAAQDLARLMIVVSRLASLQDVEKSSFTLEKTTRGG